MDTHDTHGRPTPLAQGVRVPRTAAAVTAAVAFVATLALLESGRGRIDLALGDLILAALAAGVAAGLVVVGVSVKDELRAPRERTRL